MAKTEDGEFELILGNRQLLSVFFIVVVLLGVFFTMGYIVGRNSAPFVEADAAARKAENKSPENKPIIVESPTRESAAPPAQASAAPAETAPQAPPSTEKKQAPESAPALPAESAKEAQPAPPKSAPEPSAVEPPASGQTYLQLAATTQREAEIMVDVLRKKGFKARTAEVPEKAGTYRVLVGPIEEGATNKTRADLQAAGFPGNAAIKRTF